MHGDDVRSQGQVSGQRESAEVADEAGHREGNGGRVMLGHVAAAVRDGLLGGRDQGQDGDWSGNRLRRRLLLVPGAVSLLGFLIQLLLLIVQLMILPIRLVLMLFLQQPMPQVAWQRYHQNLLQLLCL